MTALLLRRRTRIEQTVVRMMRGAEGAMAGRTDVEALEHTFLRLREAATACGLQVEPAAAKIIGRDERMLLAWVATYQRLAARSLPPPGSAALRQALRDCASLLNAEGLKLPPLSLTPTWPARSHG